MNASDIVRGSSERQRSKVSRTLFLFTADVVSKQPSSMVAVTLAVYVVLYLALIVAYVAVLKYMAEKPDEVQVAQAAERAATPVGITTSPVLPATPA